MLEQYKTVLVTYVGDLTAPIKVEQMIHACHTDNVACVFGIKLEGSCVLVKAYHINTPYVAVVNVRQGFGRTYLYIILIPFYSLYFKPFLRF